LGTSGRSQVIINSNIRRNYKAEPGRQEWITVIECICADGSHIEPLIIYKGETLSSDWISTDHSEIWHFTNNSKGWTSIDKGEEWLRVCFEPRTREKAEGRWRLLICDGHDSHISAKFVRHCIDNNIVLLLLPPHSSHLLQPLDVGVFRSLKAAMTTELNQLFRTGLHRLQKIEWLNFFKKARPKALNTSNILGGWRGAGLFPLDETRILQQLPDFKIDKSTPSPPSSPTIPTTSLYLSSSPPDAITLHETNTALKQIIAESDLNSPVRNSLRRALGFSEQLHAANSILKHENKELRELIRTRKEHESGKRVILKGKFIVSTEEVYAKLAEAEALTEAKQSKKKGKKDGVGQSMSTEKEGLQLAIQEPENVGQE
jgi:hypothetical protein